ncbi:uncharacterized protein Z518_10344 [Rhinocladiella mackenziei CBS 650.93]|uniref:Rhinocladiella mackenziei CBS 650.93 unplaced genomic scaffold supercont1.9, whole genome shotgun sequence n=1 Tax=Rhinocladiella mackenziei CBS 650.93 TaxID=1442369 RepID=A0A0D2IAD2_9EURO|nr:uncharacterized protein Z518_10344 [Rhinocladiella mackenziei CBS 650.93]KIX00206.1 hypothetical protein Z518_10344 [Rhinocladiella mackenziei CBS 650.93]
MSDAVKSRLADRERRLPEHVSLAEREERDIPLRSSPPPIEESRKRESSTTKLILLPHDQYPAEIEMAFVFRQ